MLVIKSLACKQPGSTVVFSQKFGEMAAGTKNEAMFKEMRGLFTNADLNVERTAY